MQDMPALTPPAGVESNFNDPVTLLPAVYGVVITSIVLMTSAVGIRVYTKAALMKEMRLDDCKTTPLMFSQLRPDTDKCNSEDLVMFALVRSISTMIASAISNLTTTGRFHCLARPVPLYLCAW